MHYFSRIVLHKSAISLQDFAELGFGLRAHHELAWRAFGDHPDRERDFVFRADLERDVYVIHAVSEREPSDWGGRFVVETKPYTPKLVLGQRLGFDVRVNPTVTSFVKGERGKRHDAVMHFKQKMEDAERRDTSNAELLRRAMVEWMQSRGERNGFSIEPVVMQASAYTRHEFVKSPTSKSKVQLSTAEISGVLVVEEPDSLLRVLTKGLGSAKAYGNGLLLVRPA